MIRSFLKIAYQLLQVTICVLFVVDKLQPRRLPSVHARQSFPATRAIYTQHRQQSQLRTRPTLLPRCMTWRRIFFLLS